MKVFHRWSILISFLVTQYSHFIRSWLESLLGIGTWSSILIEIIWILVANAQNQRRPSKYRIHFQKCWNWDVCLHIMWQNDVHPRYSIVASHRIFLSMSVFATYPLPEKCLFKYCTIPTSTFIIYRLKKWHHYFSSEFFNVLIVQLNYWIHLYLIVLLVCVLLDNISFQGCWFSTQHRESKAISRKYITWARQSLISVIYGMLKPH